MVPLRRLQPQVVHMRVQLGALPAGAGGYAACPAGRRCHHALQWRQRDPTAPAVQCPAPCHNSPGRSPDTTHHTPGSRPVAGQHAAAVSACARARAGRAAATAAAGAAGGRRRRRRRRSGGRAHAGAAAGVRASTQTPAFPGGPSWVYWFALLVSALAVWSAVPCPASPWPAAACPPPAGARPAAPPPAAHPPKRASCCPCRALHSQSRPLLRDHYFRSQAAGAAGAPRRARRPPPAAARPRGPRGRPGALAGWRKPPPA